MAKRFRSDKMDGRYLPEVSGQLEVWNWRPDLKGRLKDVSVGPPVGR
ncbi:MAG TPA: hypothetical protein VMW83_14540 [Spirochaetia bacterium]|nr:hypothetical protein [Spirochaetia bacterium]